MGLPRSLTPWGGDRVAAGDVIRSVNANPVTSVVQLRTMLDSFKPGDAVTLQVERKGKPMYVAFEMD